MKGKADYFHWETVGTKTAKKVVFHERGTKSVIILLNLNGVDINTTWYVTKRKCCSTCTNTQRKKKYFVTFVNSFYFWLLWLWLVPLFLLPLSAEKKNCPLQQKDKTIDFQNSLLSKTSLIKVRHFKETFYVN